MTAPESGPTLLAGREALALWFHEAFTLGNGCIHDPGLWSCKGWADALLASGVVRDVAGDQS